jgi:hypothetical protein
LGTYEKPTLVKEFGIRRSAGRRRSVFSYAFDCMIYAYDKREFFRWIIAREAG